MKKCPFCSAELLDDAEFCLYCMRQLKTKTVIEKRQKKSYLLGIIIAIALALLLCVAIVFWPKSAFTNSDFSSSDSTPTGSSVEAAGSSPEEDSNQKGEGGSLSTKNEGSSSALKTENGDWATTQTENANQDERAEPDETPKNPSQNPSQENSTSSKTEEEKTKVWETKAVSGGIEITGIATKNSSGSYTLPSTIDGKTVVGIADNAFYYETSIKSITLPNTLKYIGEKSFAGCSSLTSITIPSSVTSIKSNAFVPCSKLANIYIYSTDISIANYAFSTEYQRSVGLTIHAPSSVMNSTTARVQWDAEFKELN